MNDDLRYECSSLFAKILPILETDLHGLRKPESTADKLVVTILEDLIFEVRAMRATLGEDTK